MHSLLPELKDAADVASTMRNRRPCKYEPTIIADFMSIQAPFVDVADLRAAIRRMQPGKTGGFGGITREHLLNLPDDILSLFLPFANSILDGTCPQEFKLGIIVPLSKDERRFRPVTLLGPLWKAVMTRVSDRLLDVLHKQGVMDPAQYAFLRFGSTGPPIEIINEHAIAQDREAHIVMLDATSAYDCVVLHYLDVALRKIGAPPEFIDFIRKTAGGHTRIVSTGAGMTGEVDAFPLAGLAQGDPLSPALWVIVADMALTHARKLSPSKEGPPGQTQVAGFKLMDLAGVPDCDGADEFSVPAAYQNAKAVGTSVLAYADDLCAIGGMRPCSSHSVW